MSHSTRHAALLSLALLAGTAAAQNQKDQAPEILGRFTTGPVVGVDPIPGTDDLRPSLDTRGDERSAADGLDSRANTTTTSAQNETSMAVNPLDRLNWVGVANDYKSGNVQTGWYTTLNGGATWTTGGFGIDAGFSFSGDPSICFTPDGVVHAIYMNYFGAGGSKVTHRESTDKGLTWTASQQIDLNDANDKPQCEADHSTASPFFGQIGTAWDRFGVAGGDHIYTSVSNNGGTNWSAALRVNGNGSVTTIAPDVSYGPNGEFYVCWADRGIFDVMSDRSLNGGVSFNADVKVADFTAVPSPIPGSSFRMFDIFAVSADATTGPNSGNVYIAYHTWNAGAPANADVRVATSFDSGATFPQNVKVHTDTTNNDQVFPGICVDHKGNVNLSFYDRRLDEPANKLLWTWVARSSDAGATFRELRASDVGWNHVPTEFAGTFIGDYCDIDCSDREVHPFWCDGRIGNTQDVYTDSVNLDLVTDINSFSAAAGGQVDFSINVGPNYAGEMYILAATTSGTVPGTILPNGVQVPLNQDAYTDVLLLLLNTGFLPNGLGFLDATGSATATFDTLGPRPFLANLTFDWSVVVFRGADPDYATAPTQVLVNP